MIRIAVGMYLLQANVPVYFGTLFQQATTSLGSVLYSLNIHYWFESIGYGTGASYFKEIAHAVIFNIIFCEFCIIKLTIIVILFLDLLAWVVQQLAIMGNLQVLSSEAPYGGGAWAGNNFPSN